MLWLLAPRVQFLVNALRSLTWCCVVLLGVLSLLPAEDMVRTGAPSQLEHFLAYAATGAVAMAAYGVSHGRMRIFAALWAYAALLEYLQHFSPGRQPAIEDFAASALGGLFGGMAVVVLVRSLRRSPGQ